MFRLMMQNINTLGDIMAQFKNVDVDITFVCIHSNNFQKLHFSHELKLDNKSNF